MRRSLPAPQPAPGPAAFPPLLPSLSIVICSRQSRLSRFQLALCARTFRSVHLKGFALELYEVQLAGRSTVRATVPAAGSAKRSEPLPHRLRSECAAFTPRVLGRAFARLCSQAQLDVFHDSSPPNASVGRRALARAALKARTRIALGHCFESEAQLAVAASGYTSPDRRAVILHAPLISILRLGMSMHLVFHMLGSNESPENESYKRRRPPWFP